MLKKRRSKRFWLIGAILVVGCLFLPDSWIENDDTTSSSKADLNSSSEDKYFVFRLNFRNTDDDIISEELLTVMNDEGTITNTIRAGEDIRSALNKRSRKLISDYLDKTIDIPDVSEDELLVITIDYATGDIYKHIEEFKPMY